MNQIRPDDGTLEELFQKTLVNNIFFIRHIFIDFIGDNGFTR
jgi:hypothetical protein